MKVEGYRAIEVLQEPPLSRGQPVTEEALPPPPTPAASTAVEVSEMGQLVAELRHKARTESLYGEVRPDLIAQRRHELVLGIFGGPRDVERTLTALQRAL